MDVDEPTRRAIEEQKQFYDLRAPDYLTSAPSDRRVAGGLDHERFRALVDELHPTGDVLELGCGPGGFTAELARHARSVTAVDASAEMLARNEREVARPNVHHVVADVFSWEPTATYNVVFFGFFLSHVPPNRFDAFWALVRRCLGADGRVAFVDEDDRAAGNDDVRVLDGVPVARRTLTDGRAFDVIKVFWNPDDLTTRLRALGWDIAIRRIDPGFLLGIGADTRS